jgi:hypothetical protein
VEDKKELTIREFLKKYDAGEFKNPDVDTQIAAGWYDWFCSDKALFHRTKTLVGKLKQIVNSVKIDQDNCYVFFKNNCPMVGELYDDFRICDIETRDVIWTIVPKSGHSICEGKGEVWGKVNDFKEVIVEGTWEDILQYFNPEYIKLEDRKLEKMLKEANEINKQFDAVNHAILG